MANKKKNITPAPAKPQEQKAPIEEKTTESVTEEQPEQKAPIEEKIAEPATEEQAEQVAPVEEKATDEEKTAEPATEEQPEQEVPIEETPCPFEATVSVALAVLRKSIPPGTADMLKPVATLRQGTKVTITAVSGSNARLANGLWIALECIAK